VKTRVVRGAIEPSRGRAVLRRDEPRAERDDERRQRAASDIRRSELENLF
jgi:hypothetical protein